MTRTITSNICGCVSRARHELVARDHAALDGQHSDIARCPLRRSFDHLELAQKVARPQDGQHDLATIRRVQGDLDQARKSEEDGVAVVTLDDDPRSFAEAFRMTEPKQERSISRFEPAEKRAVVHHLPACHPSSLMPQMPRSLCLI